MDRPPGQRTCLYDATALGAVIDRMARQAAGLLSGRDKIAVIGILRRGAPLAERLTELMVRRYGLRAPLRLDLSVKRYADDLTLLHPEPSSPRTPATPPSTSRATPCWWSMTCSTPATRCCGWWNTSRASNRPKSAWPCWQTGA